jgi:Integrase
MPEVNFYLQKPKPPRPTLENPNPKPRKEYLIYLQMKYAGEKLVFSFGQHIDPVNWNSKKQRAKANASTTADGKHYVNDLLDNLEQETLQAYNELIKSGIPAPESIRARLQAFMNQNDEKADSSKTGLFALIQKFIDNDILYRGRKRKESTTRTFKTTLHHLKGFAEKNKTAITYDSITLDFYYQFVKYLEKQGLNANSRGKYIKDLKTVMGEAVDLGYTSNLQFKHKKFAVTREDTDAVYLTWDEILKLYRHDFSADTRLDRVRDLFVFACCVGLRYSDCSRIGPEHIINRDGRPFISIRTQKTGKPVIIPCHPLVIELIKKYDNSLPKAPANQVFNRYIKDVCRLAGLTDTGRLESEPTACLYECISAHTARRSCLTNFYLEGVPVYDLMKISSHSSEKSFKRYIKISNQDVATRLDEHIQKNWDKKLLRVAV